VIGIYDSGIGGVNIYNNLSEYIDTGKIVYYADTKNAPLGEKTPKEVQKAVAYACEYLFENGCSVVLLGCNTATAAAIKWIQDEWLPANYFGRKVLGIIRPVSEGLLESGVATESNILVLSTKLTDKTGFYQDELSQAGYKNVTSVAIPTLASDIENQDISKINKTLKETFEGVKDINKYNNIILACTHYPLVVDEIKQAFINQGGREDVQILDQASIVVEKFMDYLHRHKGDIVLSDLGGIFFVNGNVDEFESQLSKIFGIDEYVMEVT